VTEIPASFSLLPKLKSATVWDAYRFVIPSQSIVVEGMGAIQNYLGKFYKALTKKSLDIASLKLKAFPIELIQRPEYACIETLCLDDNPIEEVPVNISKCLTNLVVLSLKRCNLRVCSLEFANLLRLKQLFLDFNTDIVRIPWPIFDLPCLEHLGWSDLELVSPPAVILAGNVPAAQHWIGLIRGCASSGSLDIRNLKLEVFPEDLFIIARQLHHLYLEGNSFCDIPASFEAFQALQHLDMRNTLWNPFERQISACLAMTTLILNHCGLTRMSHYIFNLVCLRHLDFSFNNAQWLPTEIYLLSSLQELLLNDNPNLQTIPISIGKLTALQLLNLSSCSIGKSLPFTLSSMTNLKLLDVTNNCITHLPPSFGHMTFVSNLLLDEHCLLYPYQCVVEEGRERWMEYLRIIDINSTHLDDAVDLSYWKLPFWPLDLFGLPTLQVLLLNGNSIPEIPSKHEVPSWLQIELESKKFKGLADECESDSTIDSQSEDLFSQHTESVDSLFDENDNFGEASKQFRSSFGMNDSNSSSDDERTIDEAKDGNLQVSDQVAEVPHDTTDKHFLSQSAKIKPKIARLAAKLEALFSIRNGGITYWHSKQSVQMLPFPDISMCLKLVHLEISGNDIEKLPAGLLFITGITHLDVSYNRIEELSWGLAALKHLTNLNVVGNPIELLPRALVNLTKLKVLEFDLDGRILAPHIMIQKQGLAAMRAFWLVINKGLASGVFDFTRLLMPEFPLEFTTYKYGHINTPCKRLLLKHNNLESMDAFAPQYLQKLQFLDCSHNVLKTLPHFIKDLVMLEEITMDHNEIIKFPWQLGWTHNLRKLSFNNNLVDQLPTSLYLLSGLTSISANHNRFEILPRNLKQFPALVEVLFAHNRIRLIPDAFVPVDSLITLDLSYNHLTRVSLALLQATSIRHLRLSGNPIRSLPFGIHALVNRLSTFTFDWSKIRFPPKCIVSKGTAMIDRFQKQCISSVDTQELLLNQFQLDQIPPIFNKLEDTTFLDISGNMLMFFTLTKLVKLKNLNASKNQLSTLPVDIGRFLSLSNLNLSSNMLGFLPASFSGLLSLTELTISRNRLVELPECFTRLTKLQMLDASQNMIRCIPDDIGGKNVGTLFDDFKFGMLALQDLDFTGNSVTSIPDSFKTLSNLRSANFTGNKIFEIPSNLKQCTSLTTLIVDWQYLTDLKPLRLDQHLTTYINVHSQFFATLFQMHSLFNLRATFQGVACPVEFVRAGISKMKDFFRKVIQCIKSAEIDLSECDLLKFPTDMKCIDFLQKLDLKMNKIQFIPKVFEQYQDLVKLDLSNNRIKQLPSSLSLLTGLETLDMSNNLLESLPCELYHIPAMREFFGLESVGLLDVVAFKWAGNESTLYDPPESIVGVGFEQLPIILKYLKHIFNARRTRMIMILDIPLTRFPRTWVENDSSWAKAALTSLQMSGTKLQELPDTIDRMSNLKKLNLTRNYLEIIPASIGMRPRSRAHKVSSSGYLMILYCDILCVRH
jgi:leucine-rich repeat protein SHOC2